MTHSSDISALSPEQQMILALQSQVETLSHRLQALHDRALPSSLNASPPPPKVKLPGTFTGDRSKFRGFLYQLNLVFSLRSAEYHSDAIKVATFGTLLDGKALQWFTPLIKNGKYEQVSWSDFQKEASKIFDDPCRQSSAESELQKIHQTGSVSDYISDFNALASEVDWTEASLVSFFRRGLKSSILDLMVHSDLPTDLASAFSLALRVESRLNETAQLKRSRFVTPVSHEHRSRPVVAISTPTPDPQVMDIDAVRRGPLSSQERQRRYDNRLCLYCGEASHQIAKCPKKIQSLRSLSSMPINNQQPNSGNSPSQ